MKRKHIFLAALALLLVSGNPTICRGQELVTYPAPASEEVTMKQDFTVQVRTPEGEWKNVDTYAVKVKAPDNVELASLAYFDFSGTVEVKVTANAPVEQARIRPLSYNILPDVDGRSITFRLDKPRNLSLEVNGDIFHNLHLFANPIDTNRPAKPRTTKDFIYFAPGVHQLPGDMLNVPSGTTVYVAGGAVVKGCIHVKDAHDVKIAGRGIVHPDKRGEGIRVSRSRNVEIEGLITTQCPTGESEHVTIRNVKAISSYGWGDGMNVFASSHVLFDGVFCRNSDDCTTVYATRLGYKGGCRHITMQNSTLWADVAHPIFIGLHGDSGKFEIMEDLNYVNIDILDHHEKQIDYQGCLAINAGDNNLVRNVRFENIRIEDFRRGQLVNLRIFYNKKYCTAPGRGIENVLFKDITYNGTHAELSHIIGYDRDRLVRNIRFENLRINGTVISDDMPGKPAWYKTGDMARIFIGEHVENVTFSK